MDSVRSEVNKIITSSYTEDQLSEINIALKGGRVVCRNCGHEAGCFNILGNTNNYCGNCGVRLGMPYVENPFC